MKPKDNNSKIHFKMYKSGKQWIIAVITTAVVSIAIFGVNSLFNENVVANADVSTIHQNSNTGITTLPRGGKYVTSDNGKTWKYVSHNTAVKGLYSNGTNIFYFNEVDGTQAKGNIVSVGKNTYYFDSTTGQGTKILDYTGGKYTNKNNDNKPDWTYQDKNNNTVKGVATIGNSVQYYDEKDGFQLKGGSINLGNTNYYVDSNQGNVTSKVNRVVSSNDGTLKGLNVVNGNLQYFDSKTGKQVKNKQVAVNGVTYYFDDNGNGSYLFTNLGKSVRTNFDKYNAVNGLNKSNFTNTVDGFLTADSWYRPKQVLANGKKWRKSTSKDFRPLVTVLWPNKDVQVNYLSLMQMNGLLSNKEKYTVFSDQQTLNAAAQKAQVNIEKRISKQKSTKWLDKLLFQGTTTEPSFIKRQYVWSSASEYPGQGDAQWFQGGYLKYGNNRLTPKTNSKYRQIGNAFDFLLANDVDNSNPSVQAEDINWLHYLTHFGSITAKDPKANFDSIRIDAVDFISNDIVQRSNDYLRDLYKLTKNDSNADKHISLVEGSLEAATSYSHSDSLIESPFRNDIDGLLGNSGNPADLIKLIKEYDSGILIADHSGTTNNSSIPAYSIVHAHDKGVQERVGQAIMDNSGITDWANFTPKQLRDGLKLYYDDQRKTVKKYNDYNVPSAYAIMLTNNNTVPRIYYGDMYQDDGQFMQKKSLYYDDIVSLMLARTKYVAGGQSMSMDSNGFLTSVRYGKGANNVNSQGTSETRNEGIGVIVGNDTNKVLNDGQTVTLNMGAAHKNQQYRPVLLTTKDGIKTYSSDKNAPVVETDSNGVLTFSNKDVNGQSDTSVKGTLNPQVSGYLAVWVPVGAKDGQDARTKPSKKVRNDGKVLHLNDALASNLIFEGFSNFQPMPKNKSQYTNVVIAKNAKTFKKWGITSFEMAPQYRSTNDKSFVDSTIKNGYAFSDRYDLGFGKPTKYGTDKDLRKAIKSLHAQGMQVMADVVYNQLYNLPGKEVVSTSRASAYGNNVDVPFGNQLYVVNTIGGGKYQTKFGGKYLKELKKKYPSLFKAKTYKYYYKDNQKDGSVKLALTSSKRSSMPANKPIKEWSAKYMNGTNVLGLGMGYVLKDWNNGKYFKLNGTKTALPSSIYSKSTKNK